MRALAFVKFFALSLMWLSSSYAGDLDEILQKWWENKYLASDSLLVRPDMREAANQEQVLAALMKATEDPKKAKIANNKNVPLLRVIYEEADVLSDLLSEVLRENPKTGQAIGARKTILSERQRLNAIKEEIYDNCWNIEKERFEKLIKAKFYSINGDGKNTLAGLLSTPSWKPEKGYLYSLEYMQVLQVARDGVLMTQNPLLSATPRTAFLYTSKKFVDGEGLAEWHAEYVGTYQYQSLLGTRTVHSFKLRDLGIGQLIQGKRFYFYPNILDISDIQEEVIKDIGL